MLASVPTAYSSPLVMVWSTCSFPLSICWLEEMTQWKCENAITPKPDSHWQPFKENEHRGTMEIGAVSRLDGVDFWPSGGDLGKKYFPPWL